LAVYIIASLKLGVEEHLRLTVTSVGCECSDDRWKQ